MSGPKTTREVIVYTTDYCPYCRAAKDLLRSKGVAFEERDVTDDDVMREKLVHLTGGRTTVPQIFVDGKAMGGYDDLAAFFRNGGAM
jgi:glutaredoxin 3